MKKNQIKKMMAAVLALTMVSAGLVGCGGSSDSTKASNSASNGEKTAKEAAEVTEPITISLWHCSASGANGDYLDAAVKEFNETNEYGITVETMYVDSYSTMVSKVSTALAGNEAPELAVFADQGIPTMYSKGVFADMTAYAQRDGFDVSNFIAGTRDYMEKDGELITFPFNRSTPVLVYNKAIWEAAGLTPSEDITELYEQAKTITEKNPGVYGFGILSDPFYFQETFVRSLGSDGFVSADGNGPAALDDGNLETVLNDWLAGIDGGYMPVPSVKDTESTLKEDFYNGKSAAIVASCGGLTNMLKTAKESGVDVGVAYFPSYGGKACACGGCNMGVIGKGKSDQQIAAAWEFIKFISSDEWVAERAIKTGFIPVTYSAADTDEMKAFWEENPEYKVAYEQAEWAECASWGTNVEEWNNYLKTGISYVVQDASKTPAEAIEYLEKQAAILFD